MLIKYLDVDFRFENENGVLTQLVREGWKQFNVITSVGGKARGGHYHKFNNEAFYLVSGKYKLTVWKDDVREEYVMEPGSFYMIEPYVFHTFEYLEDSVVVSMYDKGVELSETEKDIWTE